MDAARLRIMVIDRELTRLSRLYSDVDMARINRLLGERAACLRDVERGFRFQDNRRVRIEEL